MGYLLTYLKAIGFSKLYGYDNFQQLKKRNIINYLKEFQLEEALMSKDNILSLKYTVICIIGIPFKWLDLEVLKSIIERKTVKYILISACYDDNIAKFHPDYILHTKYNKLINVYSRRIDNSNID